jgi:hypothetical protein
VHQNKEDVTEFFAPTGCCPIPAYEKFIFKHCMQGHLACSEAKKAGIFW